MSSVNKFESDMDIDIASLFVGLWRKKGRILLGSLVAAGLAYAYAVTATPKYSAAAKILIQKGESVYTRPTLDKTDDKSDLDQEAIKSQVELIGTSEILKKVASDLDLQQFREFDPVKKMGMLKHALVLLNLVNDPAEIALPDRPLTAMRENLKVYSVENSRFIVVEFSSEDAERAASVANAIAKQYFIVQRDAKKKVNEQATKYLEPQIQELAAKVKEAEAKVASYRSQSDLLIGQNNAVLATQQLSELSSELSRVRANQANAAAKAEGVRNALNSGASLDALPDIVASNLIQRLRERQVQLKTEIADLSTTLMDNHPKIIALRSQLANLQKQIASEARNILQSFEAEAQTAALRERELVRNLNTMKAESARAGDEEVQLRALESEAASQRTYLDSLRASYGEAKSREDAGYQPDDARYFPAEKAAEPYFPKKIPIVTAAFFGSLLLLSLFALVRELFSGRAFKPVNRAISADERAFEVTMPQPVANAAELPEAARPDTSMLSAAPDAPSVPEVAPEHTVSAICDRLVENGASRAIIVSPEGDEGAASAVLIARELADRGLRSILLDLTSTGSASHPMIDGFALPGITNLLASQSQFRDVIHSDPYSNAHVMPNGTAEPALAMRAVERLPIILSALTTAYDIVIVECGPVDAKGISRLVTPGAEIIMSVIDPNDPSIIKSATALQDAGYEDILLVTPVGMVPTAPTKPELSVARRR